MHDIVAKQSEQEIRIKSAAPARAPSFRKALRQAHLWLAFIIGVPLVVVSFTGSALVWRDAADRLLNPERYAISGTAIALPMSTYVANARAAAGADQLPLRAMLPAEPGWPIRISLRARPRDGAASRLMTVSLDPPTGRVLDVFDTSATLLGFLHNIHHMLNVPQFSGRQIVGWIGVVLLVLSLSGVYLWWPRHGGIRHALRWRRSARFTSNLHHTLGTALVLPLLAVTLTGIYLSFPNAARMLMSSIAPMGHDSGHGYRAMPLASPALAIDDVIRIATANAGPAARLASLDFPLVTQHGEGHAAHVSPSWRIALDDEAAGGRVSISVDDTTRQSRLLPPPALGDRATRWIEAIHEGRTGDSVWPLLAFLAGLAPAVFFVTGLLMWWKRRA